MANQWFRMYAEFANDPKVQMLSETDQRRYIMLLCIRCNGDVTLQDEEVAFQLRISNDEWNKTKSVFVAKLLITEDNKPTAWDKRQYASDSSAARVSKHREAKKQACNVTVTPQNRTDTDTEKPPIAPQGGIVDGIDAVASENHPTAKPKSQAKTFAKWIDEVRANGEKAVSDYAPVWKYADDLKLPRGFVEIAWVVFRDRFSGEEKAQRKRYTDWRKTFLNYVRNNYLKLWFWSERDNQWTLTTAGVQADRAAEVMA